MAPKTTPKDIPASARDKLSSLGLLPLLTSVRSFRTLKFGIQKVPAAMESEGRAGTTRLSSDIKERPNLCRAVLATVKHELSSVQRRRDLSVVPDDDSWWSVCVNRLDANARDIKMTTSPLAVLLLAASNKREEYPHSRHLFFATDPGCPLTIVDCSQTMAYLPSHAGWGLMPACDNKTGKPIESPADNFLITVAAPSNQGHVSSQVIREMKELGFHLTAKSGLTLLTSAKPTPKSPAQVSSDTLVKMARSMLASAENEKLPGKEMREAERAKAEAEKAKKRKSEQYCEKCNCASCVKKRREGNKA